MTDFKVTDMIDAVTYEKNLLIKVTDMIEDKLVEYRECYTDKINKLHPRLCTVEDDVHKCTNDIAEQVKLKQDVTVNPTKFNTLSE